MEHSWNNFGTSMAYLWNINVASTEHHLNIKGTLTELGIMLVHSFNINEKWTAGRCISYFLPGRKVLVFVEQYILFWQEQQNLSKKGLFAYPTHPRIEVGIPKTTKQFFVAQNWRLLLDKTLEMEKNLIQFFLSATIQLLSVSIGEFRGNRCYRSIRKHHSQNYVEIEYKVSKWQQQKAKTKGELRSRATGVNIAKYVPI